MKVSTILDHIDDGDIALPEFQRGYVWNRDQVRSLMDSLYRKHPVGSLLVWTTKAENAKARGDGSLVAGLVKLLLDGQQRITSLYGIVRGKAPRFFQGNAQAFTDLYFNLDTETFKFYAPLEMKGNALWINVTELMQTSVGAFIGKLYANPDLHTNLNQYISRLTTIENIKQIDFHMEEVTGDTMTIDVVVDIFNRVNSGGTKLSKGDLALAKICASWPEARQQMQYRLQQWENAGFSFDLDWLLRNITTVLTGQALFSGLAEVNTPDLQKGLDQTEKNINYLLTLISGRLGLDHDRVLGGRYAFPVMNRYLALRQGKINDARERDKLLYWYIHAFLWGRFAGSTESMLNIDLKAIGGDEDALDRLIHQLRLTRGDLLVRSEDFGGNTLGARFYPLLYLLTRVRDARDWGNGLPLSANMLGKFNALQVHHIFPKALLYQHGYPKTEVNAIANFCLLTQSANLDISDKKPEIYFGEVEQRYPGALSSQWIPMDRELWGVARYREFLVARRELLAQTANQFLDSLIGGASAEPTIDLPVVQQLVAVVPGGVETEQEEQAIRECNDWIIEHGLPSGEYMHELVDPLTGEQRAVLDLAWPNGLQEGLSQPVALLLDEPRETEEMANRAGYRFFTNANSFRAYVEQQILALSDVAA